MPSARAGRVTVLLVRSLVGVTVAVCALADTAASDSARANRQQRRPRLPAPVARYFNAVLRAGQGVRRSAVDAHSADAGIADGQRRLTLRLHFGDDGLIVAARTGASAATLGKQVVMLPWEGRWTACQRQDGMLLPLAGEAAWLHPDGRRPYCEGRVTSLVVRCAP